MIKVATLASLLVLVINQVRGDFEPKSWDECLFKRELETDAPVPVAPEYEPHFQANASKVDCVKEMHPEFLNRLNKAGREFVFKTLKETNTLKDIPTSVVAKFSNDTCGEFVGAQVLDQMTTSQIRELPRACLEDLISIGKMNKAQVQAINIKPEDSGRAWFLDQDNFLKHMTEGQLKLASGNDYEGCSKLTFKKLAIVNPATLAKLDYRCFNKVNWAGSTKDDPDLVKIARLVKPASYSNIADVKLPEGLQRLLKPSHLKVIDTNNNENPCATLNLAWVQSQFAGSINKKCFKNAFEALKDEDAKDLKLFFKRAHKEIFNDLKDVDLTRLGKVVKVWEVLSKEHYDAIIKHDPEICESIDLTGAKHFSYAADLGAECFAKMKTDTQKLILKHFTLFVKDDILGKLDSDHGKNLESAIKTIAVTRPSLLKHFGASEVNTDTNACTAYTATQLKDPEGLKRAAHYFPENCLRSLILKSEEDVQYTELYKYPKNFVALLDMTKLLANLSDSSLSDMDEAKWKAFIGSPIVCKALTYEQFSHVNSDISCKFMTAACLNEIKFLETLSANDESKVKQIPPAIIGGAKAEVIGALATTLNEEQVKALGANAAGLGKDAFERLTVAQVGALSAQGVTGLPLDAFKDIKGEDKWLAIKPEALASINYEQLNAVPEGILLKTTVQQAEKIPVEAVHAFTEERRGKLPPKVSEALKPLPKAEPAKK